MTLLFFGAPFLWIVLNSCGQVASPHTAGGVAPQPGIQTIRVGNAPGSVEVADFNRDGVPDLAVTSERDSSVTILLGDGNSHFKPAPGSPFFAGTLPNDMAIADFDKDGRLDIAFANHDRNYLTVLRGDGAGNVAPIPGSPFATKGIPHVHGITTGDFNGDGWPDLATDSWGNDRVEVLFADSAHRFGTQRAFFKVGRRPYQRLRAADVNGDGIPDIVTTNAESNNATVLLCNGKGGFSEAAGSPFACGDNPFGLAIGDVTGDGHPDLAVINSPSSMAEGRGRDGLTILVGNGKGGFTPMDGSPFAAGKNPNRVAVGDVNGDGVNDIVTSDFDGNRVYLFLMRSNGVLRSEVLAPGSHPKGVAIADLDGDKKGEIVVCINAGNEIAIIRGH